ncbi:MAG: hypothetical protein ACOX0U_05295 [Oscillospiraceae bacterium]
MDEIRIPAVVYQDSRLSCAARLIYGEIDRLCRASHGACQITTKQIADVYAIALGSAGAYIKQLQALGYLKIVPGSHNARIFSTTLSSLEAL